MSATASAAITANRRIARSHPAVSGGSTMEARSKSKKRQVVCSCELIVTVSCSSVCTGAGVGPIGVGSNTKASLGFIDDTSTKPMTTTKSPKPVNSRIGAAAIPRSFLMGCNSAGMGLAS